MLFSKKPGIHYLIIVLVSIILVAGQGCGILKPGSRHKAERKEASAQHKAEKTYQRAQQQHYKHQSKSTRQMMKSTRKSAAKYNGYKRRTGFGKTKCD